MIGRVSPSRHRCRVSPGETEFMRLLTTTRLLVACMLTCGLLPYAWARTVVGSMVWDRVEPLWLGILIVGMASVFALTWRLQNKLTTNSTGLWAFAISVLGGLGALGTIAAVKVVPATGFTPILCLFFLSTLWVPCAAWLGYAGRPGWWRIGGLAALVLLAIGFVFGVRVEGIDGAERVEFSWRGSLRRDGSSVRHEMPTVPPAAVGECSPDDATQFRGPNRNGKYPLQIADWIGRAMPQKTWQREVGPGWSGFAAVDNHVVTMEQLGADECVSCYRLSDGALVWRHATPVKFASIVGGDGPRSTPTIADGRVFSVGATGRLNCLDVVSGKQIWAVDLLKKFTGTNLNHGVCVSPLVDGDRVIVCATCDNGPTLVAFNKNTGDPVWSGGTHRASYSSPVIWEVDGSRQILIHNTQGLAGHDAANGQLLWQFPWTNNQQANFAQPIADASGPGTVFVSTGFGQGSALVRVSATARIVGPPSPCGEANRCAPSSRRRFCTRAICTAWMTACWRASRRPPAN